jgi:hypothetical protein
MSITGALAASTRSTYASGILRFNQFCDNWNISEGACMLASYGLLCAFIGEYKGTIFGKTIRSWLSGICVWHLANHAQWFGDCQGFTKSHSGSGPNGFRPQGLKEYSDSYLISDYSGPVLESK